MLQMSTKRRFCGKMLQNRLKWICFKSISVQHHCHIWTAGRDVEYITDFWGTEED